MQARGRLTCSFCGKREESVGAAIAHPGLHICDECATIADRLMYRESSFTDAPISVMLRSVIERCRGIWTRIAVQIGSRKICQGSFLSERMEGISGRVHGPSSDSQQLRLL